MSLHEILQVFSNKNKWVFIWNRNVQNIILKKSHLSQCTWRKFSSELLSLTITYEEEQKHTYTPAWNLSENTKTDWIGFDFISIETNKTCWKSLKILAILWLCTMQQDISLSNKWQETIKKQINGIKPQRKPTTKMTVFA